MAVMRWSPWHELESMQHQLNRMVGDYPTTREEGRWAPLVDIRETEDALLLHAELPGVDKKDIKLEVRDGVLTVSGERRYEKAVEEENIHRIERSYGSFSRSFSLPRNIDTERIEAETKHGVLEVRLPKHEGAKARAIEVR